MNHLIDRIRNIDYTEANSIIRQLSGIVGYFASEDEKLDFISEYECAVNAACDDRVSYGDWQTPMPLARKVCENHAARFGEPDVVIEPTCGLGAFVLSALDLFTHLSEIHAVEINRSYTSELKLRLLIRALGSARQSHPDIYIYNADFFEFDFTPIINRCTDRGLNLAVIGNPPWVTNSRQGKDESDNIPIKDNRYGLKGIDAITGKSNFDISEYITLHLLRLSQSNNGGISFLLKNSVIRSILTKQKKERLHIGGIEQQLIDASSEFNVSVDASCFSASFADTPSLNCRMTDFYDNTFIRNYGWVKDAFVSDTDTYNDVARYDGTSTLVWRSGIKHDCASVLELTAADGVYVNGLGEVVNIEDDMIYPLLKSSDIGNYRPDIFRKYLIVHQHKAGQDTSPLRLTHPLTYAYLTRHAAAFSNRKSSIYRGKDRFSIFGVGDYSFSPYKIVVSSLYKDVRFILVSQSGGKPVIVDDTCYQLGFDDIVQAQRVYRLIQSDEIQSLLKSLIFSDAKRVVTKSLLMRLDLTLLGHDKGVMIESRHPIDEAKGQLSLFD